jgi:hypothetical protein
MTPEAKQLIAHLRRKTKRDYLLEVGVAGGTEDDFVTHVWKDYRAHPDDYPLHAMLAICTRHAWKATSPWDKREDEEVEEHDLFSVAGYRLDRELTIPDPLTPVRYRQVLTEIAPIAFQREDAIITMTQGARISQRGLEAMRAYQELLKRADGDPQQLISKFADRRDKPKPKPKPTRPTAGPGLGI